MIEGSLKGNLQNFTAEGINLIFKLFGTKIFITKTVKELISGYKDPLLTIAKQIIPNVVKSDLFSMLNGVRNLFILSLRNF